MKNTIEKIYRHSLVQPVAIALLATSALSACSAMDRVKDIGQPPAQTGIINPTMKADYQPVSMPMPAPKTYTRQANSLWTGSQKGFFKDQRADEIGDILTVIINIDDKGQLKDETTRTRDSAENLAVPKLFGLETKDFAKVLPESVDPTDLVTAAGDSNHKGTGKIDRQEKIEMKLAATIMQVLPNGNMVISGTQEVRVNYENRILKLNGIIRPEDIGIENSIPYDKIAEARISYGGKGQLSDVQQPRYGQQLYDIVAPF